MRAGFESLKTHSISSPRSLPCMHHSRCELSEPSSATMLLPAMLCHHDELEPSGTLSRITSFS